MPITGTHWAFDALTVDGARKTPPKPTLYIEFKPEGRAHGNAGCNDFEAETAVDGDTVTVGKVVLTQMACNDQGFESDFRKLFTGRLEARLDGDRLTLTTPDGDAIALSEQPEAPLEGTRWSVETLVEGGTAASLPAGVRGRPHLTVGADGTARGNLGCNNFTATVKTDGDELTFGSLTVTRRMCAPPQNELERKLYGTLGGGPVTYRVEQRTLTVTARDGSGFGARATTP
ncbi:META domain-containing protein [Streptomyces somaliensis]|uniref:META domain-containing protein n=1 Tax=Streptomyces somaliensis TaxID=78355 RepID=UPI0034E941E2